MPPPLIRAPANAPVLDNLGNHSQAWAAHHDEISDFIDKIGVGRVDGLEPSSGDIGEFLTSQVVVGSAVALASFVPLDVTHIDLPAGDWDVWGSVVFAPAGGVAMGTLAAWVSLASATLPGDLSDGGFFSLRLAFSVGQTQAIPAGRLRFNTATTERVYLSALAGFTGAGVSAYGRFTARRMS